MLWTIGAAAAGVLVFAAAALVARRRAPSREKHAPAAQSQRGVQGLDSETPAVSRPAAKAERVPPRDRAALLEAIWEAEHRAERQMRRGASAEALASLRTPIRQARALIAAAPGTAEARRARYRRFRCLEMAGERRRAEVAFEGWIEAVERAEGAEAAARALLAEGRRASRLGTYAVALDRWRGVLARVRGGELAARAYAGIGRCQMAMHQADQAEASFRQALALGLPPAEAARCLRRLAAAAMSQGRLEQAERDCRALLALPAAPRQRANDQGRLGLIIERTAGPLKAAAHYRRIVNAHPELPCTVARARLRRLTAQLEADILAPLPGEQGAAAP
jgi:tetratricopeptide (TPR) repeat protein